MPTQTKYGLGVTGSEAFELLLPSGNTCLVRSLGIEALISAGLLENFDGLTSMVKDLHLDRVAKGKANKPEEDESILRSLIKEPEKWGSFQKMLDGILVAAVVEPKVLLAPDPNDQRDWRKEGVLYADQIDFADRVAVMKAAMKGVSAGVDDLKPFRAGSTEDLPDLGDVAGLPREAKRAAKRAKRGSGSVSGSGRDHIRKGDGD